MCAHVCAWNKYIILNWLVFLRAVKWDVCGYPDCIAEITCISTEQNLLYCYGQIPFTILIVLYKLISSPLIINQPTIRKSIKYTPSYKMRQSLGGFIDNAHQNPLLISKSQLRELPSKLGMWKMSVWLKIHELYCPGAVSLNLLVKTESFELLTFTFILELSIVFILEKQFFSYVVFLG